MFKEGHASWTKYNELKDEYRRLKDKKCGTKRGASINKSRNVSHKRSSSYEMYNDVEKLVLGLNDVSS